MTTIALVMLPVHTTEAATPESIATTAISQWEQSNPANRTHINQHNIHENISHADLNITTYGESMEHYNPNIHPNVHITRTMLTHNNPQGEYIIRFPINK